ncbi:hypothetical protein C0993_011564 [Termitomyces sp. T159_Od127]|nr:hypothetical protein C0993_011564 [Termitomyces sp. T159_Od127]
MSDDARPARRRNLIVTNPSPQNDGSDDGKSVNNYFVRILNRFPAVPGPDPPILPLGTPPTPKSRAARVYPSFRSLPRPPTPPAIESIVKTLIVVTMDSDWYVAVDISGATNATFIRERIFNKFNICDGEVSRFAIYQTEIGASVLGESLNDEKLFACCRDKGDSKGSLKFLVTDASVSIHDQLRQPIPLPVLPSCNSTDPAPLHPKHRSRQESVSSANQQYRLESSGGHEADLVHGRNINKPLPPTPLRPLPSPQHHPLSNASASLRQVSRLNGPLPQPGSPGPQHAIFTSSPPIETSPSELGNALLRQLAAVPLLSPDWPTFTTDENVVLHPAYQFRGLTGSDEHEVALRSADYDRDVTRRKIHALCVGLRPQPSHESSPLSAPLNDGRNRILDEEDLVRSDSWGVLPPPVSRSNDQDLTPIAPETTFSVSPHQSATRPSPPSRPSVTSLYTDRPLPVHPRHLPPVPTPAHKIHQTHSSPSRSFAGVPPPSKFFAWRGEQILIPTKTTQWNRLGKGSKSVDSLRNFNQASSTMRCQVPPVPSYSSCIPGVSRSYDSRPTVRPLPMYGSLHGSTVDFSRDASKSRSITSNTVSQNQDPYLRLQSASGGSASSTRRPRVQSLGADSGDNVRSPRGISSSLYQSSVQHLENGHSHRLDGSSDMTGGAETSYSTPPHTPIGPRSPLSPHWDQSSPSRQSTSGSKVNDVHDLYGGSDSTLPPEDQQWVAATLNSFSQGIFIASRGPVKGKNVKPNTASPAAARGISSESDVGPDYRTTSLKRRLTAESAKNMLILRPLLQLQIQPDSSPSDCSTL